MRKVLVALVASVVALVATSAGAQAAFTVTVTFPGFTPPPGSVASVLATNPNGVNSFAVANAGGASPTPANELSSSTSTTALRPTTPISRSTISLENGSGGSELALLITSLQNGVGSGVTASRLVSNFTLTNDPLTGGGVVIPTIIITIRQDAYTFSDLQNNFDSNASIFNTVTGAPGPFAGTSVAFSATATNGVNTTTISTPTSFLSPTGVATNVGGSNNIAGSLAGIGSITQTFTITNLQIGQHISFSADSGVATPLPATALMAAIGLPLLGLAGAFRRRVMA